MTKSRVEWRECGQSRLHYLLLRHPRTNKGNMEKLKMMKGYTNLERDLIPEIECKGMRDDRSRDEYICMR